jgi:DGQHR domain-containing protein
MSKLTFPAVMARQSPQSTVVSFAASAHEVLSFASIDRVARDADGHLSGFQRPQIASHIREIRDYLETPEAVLPNPIVVAFTAGIEVKAGRDGACQVSIDVSGGPCGLIVDGQQRITALSQVEGKDFQVFVSALVCRDETELRRQFVLINNTRPLPKTLIYELLPTVLGGLPRRLSERSIAADLTARLNCLEPLEGRIKQHTRPTGVISDIAVQKFFLNSLSDGAMRLLVTKENGAELCLGLAQEFFKAVAYVFRDAWEEHTPKTSRLVHGAGIIAMGYVMDLLHRSDGARTWQDFASGMSCLVDRVAWTAGEWDFGGDDRRHWKAIQNTGGDIATLTAYLTRVVSNASKARKAGGQAEPPLLKLAQA